MAVRKPPKGKKGKAPESIPMNLEFIKNRIANGELGVIEEWKKNYSEFPKPLKAALKQEGISSLFVEGKDKTLVENT